MSRHFLVLGLGLGLAALAGTSLVAETRRNCAPRDSVVTRLADSYGETRQSIGLGANNALVEIFASEETGTWTITMTTPNGMTCLVASGQAFETLAEALKRREEDA